jgi:hypothetical protein
MAKIRPGMASEVPRERNPLSAMLTVDVLDQGAANILRNSNLVILIFALFLSHFSQFIFSG